MACNARDALEQVRSCTEHLNSGRPSPVSRAKVCAANGHTSLWASWLWGASLSLADLSNVCWQQLSQRYVSSRMDSAVPPACPAQPDPSGRVHSQTFCARRNTFWRGGPRRRRQAPSCAGCSWCVEAIEQAKRHFPSTAFWLRCRLHMPSATLKRLNTMMRCVVATEEDRPCRFAGHYCAHAGLEWSPKLLQSVGELQPVHRHANIEPQGVLLRFSETRPRHTGRRPVLSMARVQPESRALRDFAKR